ncbi:hypothetical protein Cme02nite_64250 [Catellatospora methionotrophica]|uniref:DUF2267 domain-containing protein n=1 Tax=Catellatospora methionotrophica TaxID=121620 RepID=A0A8J3PJ27_9ACTN|nr:DUF2267 domain-containing protein [Catellatospora methionotrophica]GIG18093.1 hypothetical protein Cme02nite_64250 [Catellatospora methionotrophica]
MGDKQFFRKVAELSGLTVEEAADTTRATLECLAARLSNGENRHLAAHLHEGLRDALPPSERIQCFDLPEMLRRVRERTGLNERDTESGVRGVMTALREDLGDETFDHVMQQLPNDFRTMAMAGTRATV